MRHYSESDWTKYVNNELEEHVREAYEKHLYSCDQCLELYVRVIEQHEDSFPVIIDETDFANSIMEAISEQKIIQKQKATPFYQKALFHYTLAAAMTLLLMMTGVFHSITEYAESIQLSEQNGEQSSMTDGIMNKTFAWMDSLETNHKEVDNK
ncbi:hypothetical protein [Bacillus sp. 03113]|uniref:hypothetical protein n=1 Tax=Bacillus sp. 03113 TaxID=2578211 RepID=UPI00114286F3|nr:hypothetical protein [Bacillus sp. 03113]